MDEATARSVVAWRYAPPFDVYNTDPAAWDGALAGLLDPRYAYYALLDERGQAVAFACFGEDAQVPGGDYRADALDLGWGLHPALLGQGHGLSLVTAILAFGRSHFDPPGFRTTIAGWNERSRRVAEKAGFRAVQTFRSRSHRGSATDLWVVLMCPAG